ncbi:Tyrosine-specific transport protein [Vibrio nigripulchritudo MADA3029]|uniref:aromatic amino acid transport family protein n=1 Tax=Vibrio nigripulchritudo TaxID=28173 RepID=UPI0003B1E7D7|nr:aromatic amino acid transport family protein [Vibrio nigripulchritudo]CCN49777.1 Tyrosine-specific transport protein [Vibrio nigripulchritudo MADA3020]CCN54726.1 Tyrosine-specific transport protein [Vibrio nigripulchritudo MADA3021]CCN61710.1 Tyrosine-specific transport protein [Vibrio nigripulchritudo MADA3029]
MNTHKSKVFGSTLIIAGTTIGAGMLALPLASAGIGFITSLMIMLGIWLLMVYTALLMLEVHQHADADATLHTLAQQFLGKKGKWVATFAMLFLFYALCAAYIAGGGEQFHQRLSSLMDIEISPTVSTVIFTALVAGAVTLGTSSVDKINRVLFTIKILAMGITLYVLAPGINSGYLVNIPVQQALIISALPVIFTSFGFHGSIPAVVKYLDKDIKGLRIALILGSSLPLLLYVLWQVSTLGVLSQDELNAQDGLAGFMQALSSTVQSGSVQNAISVFADLALLTSFLGVSLGLFEFLGDSLKKHTKDSRVKTALITFVPPMAFALFYPQGFIMALGYAAIALVVLAVFLPVKMAHTARKIHSSKSTYVVAGGSASLAICMIAGITIIATQFLISFGLLASIG